jgi:hypothetical protein
MSNKIVEDQGAQDCEDHLMLSNRAGRMGDHIRGLIEASKVNSRQPNLRLGFLSFSTLPTRSPALLFALAGP